MMRIDFLLHLEGSGIKQNNGRDKQMKEGKVRGAGDIKTMKRCCESNRFLLSLSHKLHQTTTVKNNRASAHPSAFHSDLALASLTKMMSTRPCRNCNKTVYVNEKMEAEGSWYHRPCFKVGRPLQ